MTDRKLLLVSHEASRTGAPKVARHLLDAFAGEWTTVLVHRWGGPMRAELDAAADSSFLEPLSRVRVSLRRHRRTKRAAGRIQAMSIRATLRRVRPDVVWCNTVMASSYVPVAESLGIPVVLHSHEQAQLVGTALRSTGIDPTAAARSTLLTPVGCATDTAAALAGELGIAADAVHVLHSPVDVAQIRADAAASERPFGDGPVVVACGTGDHRKGIDVFGAAATASVEAADGIEWVWVGRVADDARVAAVTYAGERLPTLPWIAHADVVALPSRADPFPLVVLEAMALGKPVVASAIPGPMEQLGDAGTFVAPEDAADLAGAVRNLIADEARRDELGRAGARRCAEQWDLGPFGERARAIAALAATTR